MSEILLLFSSFFLGMPSPQKRPQKLMASLKFEIERDLLPKIPPLNQVKTSGEPCKLCVEMLNFLKQPCDSNHVAHVRHNLTCYGGQFRKIGSFIIERNGELYDCLFPKTTTISKQNFMPKCVAMHSQ